MAAERPTTLVRDLGLLAELLGLADAELADEHAAAGAARRHLETSGDWLLIFDNAPDPAVVRPWLPRADSGHVLVTSRYMAWGGLAHGERVGTLAADDAVQILERRSGQRAPHVARALAQRPGGLPLALEQAGAYLEATGMPFAEYLAMFDARERELLARAVEPDAPTVAATWQLSFRELDERAPYAAELLTLAAFLAADDIPRSLLTGVELPESLTPLTDAFAFNDAVAALARYSLIACTGDAFAVHRLVQDVTRDRLGEDDRRRWARAAVRLLAATFPFSEDDAATWEPTGRLLPHSLRACEHANAVDVAPAETRRLRRGGAARAATLTARMPPIGGRCASRSARGVPTIRTSRSP